MEEYTNDMEVIKKEKHKLEEFLADTVENIRINTEDKPFIIIEVNSAAQKASCNIYLRDFEWESYINVIRIDSDINK